MDVNLSDLRVKIGDEVWFCNAAGDKLLHAEVISIRIFENDVLFDVEIDFQLTSGGSMITRVEGKRGAIIRTTQIALTPDEAIVVWETRRNGETKYKAKVMSRGIEKLREAGRIDAETLLPKE